MGGKRSEVQAESYRKNMEYLKKNKTRTSVKAKVLEMWTLGTSISPAGNAHIIIYCLDRLGPSYIYTKIRPR